MPDATPTAHLPGAPTPSPVGEAGADLARPSAGPETLAVLGQQLRTRLRDAPAAMASLAGPDHLVSVANDLFRQLFGGRLLAGLALRTALPELADQPFFPLLDEAYRTGVTSYGHEAVAYADPAGLRGPLYFTFMAQAVRDAPGTVAGLLLFAYNVSAHVLAHAPEAAGTPPPTATAHELALANEELATTNEELATTNEELLVSNEELATTNAQLSTANVQLQASSAEIWAQAQELRRAQKALRHLNQQLEGRVAERTAQLRDALAAAEQTAAQREASHQVFEQTSAVIVLLRGPEHRIDYYNAAYQQLFVGRAQRGRRMAEMAPETERQGFVALLDRVYETGETHFGVEVPLLVEQPSGQPIKTRYFNFTYQRFEEDGQPAGISVFAYDVAEQVLARHEREAQQTQLAELFEQAPVAIAVVRGAQYVIEVVNPLMAQLWDRTPEQVRGKTLYDALPEVRDQGFKELLDRVVASGEAFVAQEVPAQLPRAGQLATVYLNFVYQPLRDAQGRIDSVAAVATDVTAQVLARQQLTAVNQQLTLTNTDLDNFVYAASHDLKLPMLNLAGLFDELRRSVSFTDAAEEALLVPLITQALHQLSTSLDDLAALGQAQQAAHVPAEPVVLEALVEEILHTLEPQVRAASARVTTDFAARPTLTYPRASLHTVLLNLLSNALKYADPARPARIHCSLWLAAGEPVLWVTDNGVGFDAAGHGPELFQLFRRFHAHVEGTGVGLYLVNRLLLAKGGHLEVDSQVGAGATFRAYLGPA